MYRSSHIRTRVLSATGAALFACLAADAGAVVFQAENYGAYHDTTPGNSGGAYRADDVDIEATTDGGGGHNVGWIATGEWLAYAGLSIPATGSYTIRMRVASPVGATASVDLNGGTVLLGNFAIPNTGGWQNWTTVSRTVTLSAGTHSLGVYAQSGDWNFNWIEVVPAGTTEARAVVHQHCNYGGWAATLDVGSYRLAALQSRGLVNDAASSIQVAQGYEAVLYENDNFGGASTVVRGNDACLDNEAFNDRTSSIIVRPAARNLVWSDEFDSASTANWTFETGGHGWGNSELQYYTNGQNAFIQHDASIGSNVLVIEARRGAPSGASCWYGSCQYSSTRMISRGKREFRHGRIEARIRLPQTQGIWPAFWMLGSNFGQVGWPNSGEIDIMEHVGFEPMLTHGAIHGPGYSGNTPFTGTHDLGQQADAAYRLYAVEWDTNGIRWFVDGQQFYAVTRAQVEARGAWVFDQPFFLLLNIAVGGTWPGSPDASSVFPQRMYVDYVRVYQ
ncbi:carbohydrate-binding protein [Luteimonas sp. SDU82]|uniref:carbohydrate-binding protein n=1 Tax=Luteimonas sp. SDU82 TaxID=3422592 RepID=UPI003EBD2B34